MIAIKFIYSEKATKFCEISTVDLSYVVPVKSTVEISQTFVAFSEYMNFKVPSEIKPPLVDLSSHCALPRVHCVYLCKYVLTQAGDILLRFFRT